MPDTPSILRGRSVAAARRVIMRRAAERVMARAVSVFGVPCASAGCSGMADAGGSEGGIPVRFGVVGRHGMASSAVLVQANPPALPVLVVVLTHHPDHGAHTGDAVDYQSDQRPVTQADHARRVDAVASLPGIRGRQHRNVPCWQHRLRPRTATAGCSGMTLA